VVEMTVRRTVVFRDDMFTLQRRSLPGLVVAPAGSVHIGRLIAVIEGESGALPGLVVKLASMLVKQIMTLSEEIGVLEGTPGTCLQ
jgi:hypothetical protein